MPRSAATPQEADRLATLWALNILDTPAEEEFDRLTRTAVRLFDVPMAAISLVDADRLWAKSRVGLPIAETPREASFCDQAVRDGGPLVVPDAAIDPRFAGHPLVTGEAQVRFYAGHVLRASNGQALGTLCLMDRVPRRWEAPEAEALADMAEVTATAIQRRYEELRQAYEERTLREMALSLSAKTGQAFFNHLVSALAALLGVDSVYVMELERSRRDSLRSVACFRDGRLDASPMAFALAGSPCASAIEDGTLSVPADLQVAFPHVRMLAEMNAEGYVGTTLTDSRGEAIGVLSVIHGRAIARPEAVASLLALLRDRVAAELERWRADETLARQTAYMQLLEVIAVAANESESVEQAIAFSLARVCALTGWPVGRYRQIAPGNDDRLSPTGCWHFEAPERHQSLATLDEAEDDEPAVVGRVLATGYAATSRLEFDGAAWSSAARRLGLTAGFAFPVVARGLLLGVLEFYSDGAAGPDASLLDVMSHIGAQLAQVVERTQTRLALARQEHMYRLIAENSNDIISITTADGSIRYISPACQRVLGYPVESLLKHGFFAIIHPDDVPLLLETSPTGPNPTPNVYRARHRDGHDVWLEAVTRVVRDAETGLVERISVTRDITDRQGTETQLRESEERYRRILELMPDTVAVHRHGRFIYVNSAGVRLLKASGPEAIVGRPILDFIHPSFHRIVSERVTTKTEDGRSPALEQTMLAVDGTALAVEVTGIEIMLAGQEARLAVIRDISSRRRAEMEKRESEELIRSIVASSHDGIILTDDSGLILAWNHGAERIFGYEADETIGVPMTLIMPERHWEAHQAGMARVSANAETYDGGRTLEVTGRRKDGHEFPAELSIASWTVRGRRFFSGIIRDITDRREIERLKSDFISIVSHELRTPINTMLGALELLHTGMVGDLPPRAARMVEISFNNTGRLKRLVNDMLDLQLLEWGRLPIALEKADASALMREAVDSMQDQAERLEVRLELMPFEAPVLADADRIVQTLVNLLGNALKYTPAGGRVWVQASVEGEEVRFEVGDTGRGIPPDQLNRIFEKYQQVAPGDSREKGGAGLGLAISRAIVERHQGRVWAESVVGEGSRFYFTLPLATPADGRPGA